MLVHTLLTYRLLVAVHFLWACTICLARHIVMAYTAPHKMFSYIVHLKYVTKLVINIYSQFSISLNA